MRKSPLLLDLFCGAGGASMGYHRAGFDVIGVDILPQKNYPFEFVQGDALDFLREHGHEFDAIHASPPCHDHIRSKLTTLMGQEHGTGWLLEATRVAFIDTDLPWVIENVPGAPMRADITLCGCRFALPGLRRSRLFETSWRATDTPPPHDHSDPTITVTGHAGGSSKRTGTRGYGSTADWRRAMGIDWMTGKELAQAIPPAYTEYVGGQLLAQIGAAVKDDLLA